MPTLDTLPLPEARASCATGQRAALLNRQVAALVGVAPFNTSRTSRV